MVVLLIILAIAGVIFFIINKANSSGPRNIYDEPEEKPKKSLTDFIKTDKHEKSEKSENSASGASENESEKKDLLSKIKTPSIGSKKPVVEEKKEAKKREPIKVSNLVRVLVVDDDVESRLRIERIAKDTGAEVVTCENGIQCLEKVKTLKYDVIFIARSMLGMDGVQTVRNMNRLEDCPSKNAAKIVVVERDSVEPWIFFDNAGFKDMMRKPAGDYVIWNSIAENIASELMKSEEPQLKEIREMAKSESELSNIGLVFSEAMNNFKFELEDFKEKAIEFCDEYDELSGSVMDNLYDGVNEEEGGPHSREYMNQVRTLREEARKLGLIHLSDIFDDHVNMAKDGHMDIAESSWRNLELEWEAAVSGLNHWLGRKDTISNATAILTDK